MLRMGGAANSDSESEERGSLMRVFWFSCVWFGCRSEFILGGLFVFTEGDDPFLLPEVVDFHPRRKMTAVTTAQAQRSQRFQNWWTPRGPEGDS